MLSTIRLAIIATLSFLSLFSISANAQLKNLDKDFGYSSYRFGTDKSAFSTILGAPDKYGDYPVKIAAIPELQYIFGDSVEYVSFGFGKNNTLRSIKIDYYPVEKKMEKEEANQFLDKITTEIQKKYGDYTDWMRMFPTMKLTWSAKKTNIYYMADRRYGKWQRSVLLTAARII